MSHHYNARNGLLERQYSAAVMLDASGVETGVYQKNKRIPFGEYAPFAPQGSTLRRLLESLFGDFLTVLEAGDSHRIFDHQGINLVPLICYETTFPTFVANAVNASVESDVTQSASILVALSNDGWFGSTHQPYQHVFHSVLRAVENRTPLVHVANNGPSIVVLPSGKVMFTSDFQTAAAYVVDVPYSAQSQGSFYSRHPTLFIHGIYGLLALLLCLAFIRSR